MTRQTFTKLLERCRAARDRHAQRDLPRVVGADLTELYDLVVQIAARLDEAEQERNPPAVEPPQLTVSLNDASAYATNRLSIDESGNFHLGSDRRSVGVVRVPVRQNFSSSPSYGTAVMDDDDRLAVEEAARRHGLAVGTMPDGAPVIVGVEPGADVDPPQDPVERLLAQLPATPVPLPANWKARVHDALDNDERQCLAIAPGEVIEPVPEVVRAAGDTRDAAAAIEAHIRRTRATDGDHTRLSDLLAQLADLDLSDDSVNAICSGTWSQVFGGEVLPPTRNWRSVASRALAREVRRRRDEQAAPTRPSGVHTPDLRSLVQRLATDYADMASGYGRDDVARLFEESIRHGVEMALQAVQEIKEELT